MEHQEMMACLAFLACLANRVALVYLVNLACADRAEIVACQVQMVAQVSMDCLALVDLLGLSQLHVPAHLDRLDWSVCLA